MEVQIKSHWSRAGHVRDRHLISVGLFLERKLRSQDRRWLGWYLHLSLQSKIWVSNRLVYSFPSNSISVDLMAVECRCRPLWTWDSSRCVVKYKSNLNMSLKGASYCSKVSTVTYISLNPCPISGQNELYSQQCMSFSTKTTTYVIHTCVKTLPCCIFCTAKLY